MHVMVAAPEHGRVWGGIGTYLSQLLRGLRGKHAFTVLCGEKPPTSSEGIEAVPLGVGGGMMATYAKFQLALRRRLPEIVRERRPDLFVAHHAQMPDLLASPPTCPTVLTTHTTLLGQARGAWAGVRVGSPLDSSERVTLAALPALLPAERYYWSRVRHALFVSHAVRREAEGAFAPRLRTSATILNGMAFDEAIPGGSEDEDFLLFTGRLLGWKGLAVLLQAMAAMPDAPPLRITGSGDVARWEAYASSLGLTKDRVRFLGVVPRDELLRLVRGARAYVFPSFTESCPYSIMEAMAFGKPIVASAVGGILDMVEDGTSAVLVPPGDPGALAAGIRRVLADEGFARRIGQAAKARASERFSVERMAADTEAYFERVLASP